MDTRLWDNMMALTKKPAFMDFSEKNKHTLLNDAFNLAASSGYLPFIDFTLSSPNLRPYVQLGNENELFTILCRASCGNHVDIVQYLLTQTKEADRQEIISQIAVSLEQCATCGAFEAVKYLVNFNDKPFNVDLYSVLSHAVKRNHHDITHYLVVEYGLPITDELRQLMQVHPQINTLVENRLLQEKLQEDLRIQSAPKVKCKV